ncbi:virulence RhuM family protein [Candidatus Uhrbacteria bacterium]|nr:virulence RhuM family protein [Candidatus Uhrbacteria bacterium]
MEKQNSIIIYERKDGAHFEVTLKEATIWLSQQQIANLFVVRNPAVSKHIKNIYAEGELDKKSTVSKMETVRREGGRFIKRKIEYYNLDMIIAVGYRVSSRHATRFRIWATRILHDHLVKGYTVNERRLKQEYDLKIKELERAVALLQAARDRSA